MCAPNRLARLCLAIIVFALLPAALAPGCDDAATSAPDEGSVTLANDDGIDFVSGRLQEPGNFANSDLFATTNGDSGMKLTTGGTNPTDNRPITWFKNGGGIATEFPDLASVPFEPPPSSVDPMLHAKAGHGFMLRSKNGDLVRGWLAAASATSITLQWERVAAE